MTLPEHAICSVMLAQFGVRQRWGGRGVALVTFAGIAPDLDSAAKLFSDSEFWRLHHALGHSLLSIFVIATSIAGIGYSVFRLRPFTFLFLWCLFAAFVHCLTDSLFWWGVRPLWPFAAYEIRFDVLEYLDLIVLAIWFTGAICLYKFRNHGPRVAAWTLTAFASYVLLRSFLPPPIGFLKFVTGGWMYEAPQGTPVLDWW